MTAGDVLVGLHDRGLWVEAVGVPSGSAPQTG